MNQNPPSSGGLLVLTASDIESVLTNRERDIIAVIRTAYQMHDEGQTVCPQSTFLHMPLPAPNRIITMPAYVGGELRNSGMKWISSFPANLDAGLPRASALIALNSIETGRVFAVLEGSLISARRTAASAALAVVTLASAPAEIRSIGVIGCGLINREVVRFVSTAVTGLREVIAFDTQPDRVPAFARRIREFAPHLAVAQADSTLAVFSQVTVASVATTALVPHIPSLATCRPGALILHISLRDILPDVLTDRSTVDNVVDDVDHSLRAGTSLELASHLNGGHGLIRTTLGRVLNGKDPARHSASGVTVFSPFGLAVLDVALASYVYKAIARGNGVLVPDFHPPSDALREVSLAASIID